MKAKKFLFTIPILLIAVLSSCIDMEASVSFEEDASGTIEMFYSVSRMVTDLGKLDDKDPFIPLPLSEDDFTATAARIQGLSLVSVTEKVRPKTMEIRAKMEFDSPKALAAFFSADNPENLTIQTAGGGALFRYVLFTAAPEAPNRQSMDLIRAFFVDNAITLKLEAPEDISSVNIGTAAGNEAELQMSILDIFQNNTDIIWEVRW